MKCYMHPGLGSVATCISCGRGVCVVCAIEFDDGVLCRACAAKRLNLVTPTPAVAVSTGKAKSAAPMSSSSAWVGPEPNVEYPPSVCYMHPKVGSVAVCAHCHKGVCAVCATEVEDELVCRSCAETLRKKAPKAEPVAEAATAALHIQYVPPMTAISIATLAAITQIDTPQATVPEARKAMASMPSPATFSLATLVSVTQNANVKFGVEAFPG